MSPQKDSGASLAPYIQDALDGDKFFKEFYASFPVLKSKHLKEKRIPITLNEFNNQYAGNEIFFLVKDKGFRAGQGYPVSCTKKGTVLKINNCPMDCGKNGGTCSDYILKEGNDLDALFPGDIKISLI